MAKKQPRERKYVICENCGNVVPVDATVCDECGAELPKLSPEERRKLAAADVPEKSKAEAKAAAKAAAERRKAAKKAREEAKAAAAKEAAEREAAEREAARAAAIAEGLDPDAIDGADGADGTDGEADGKTKTGDFFKDMSLKTNRRLQEILICIVAVIILAVIIDFRYRVAMPDLTDLEAVDARNHLTELGFKPENLHFKTEDGTDIADPSDGLFIVLSQDPAKDRKVRKSKSITMVCEDREGAVREILRNAYYEHPAPIIAKLKEYYYSVDVVDSAGYDYSEHYDSYNDDQKNLLYIIDIGELDRKTNSVALFLDNEFNIEVAVEDLLDGYEGKSTLSAIQAAAKKHYGYVLKLPDKTDYTATFDALSDDDKADQIVRSLTFDHDNRKIVIVTQSKKDIEEKNFLAELKEKIPYVGLDEKYIDNTLMGAHDKYSSRSELYEWMSDDGKYQVLTVACKDGKVTSVNRKYEDVYWADENKPDTSVNKDAVTAQAAAGTDGAEDGAVDSAVTPRRPH